MNGRVLALSLAVLGSLVVFQNCSGQLKGVDDSVSSSSSSNTDPSPGPTSSPGPTPTAGPNPSPGPAPMPNPDPGQILAPQIPRDAIVEIQLPAAAAPYCPTGYIYNRFYSCVKPYSGEASPSVVTEVRAPIAGVCPAGFLAKPAGNAPRIGTIINACVKFSAPSAGPGIVTQISIRPTCASWESSLPYPDVAGVSLCYVSYSNRGRPLKAIGSLYLPADNVGCKDGDRLLTRFRAGGLAVTSTLVCANYVSANDAAATLVETVETPPENQPCSAGFLKMGDMFNSHVATRKWALCAKMAAAPMVQRPITTLNMMNVGTNCVTGDDRRGSVPRFSAGPGLDYYIGQGNLCLQY